jgi:transposase
VHNPSLEVTAQAARAERRSHVWAMRLEGYTYREIADAVGCSYETARTDCQQVLQELQEEQQAVRSTLTQQHLARLQLLLTQLIPSALGGNTKAAATARAIIVDMAKMDGSYTERSETKLTTDLSPQQAASLQDRLAQLAGISTVLTAESAPEDFCDPSSH